jgi:hypothetical protein
MAVDVGQIFWEWRVDVIGEVGVSKGRFVHSNFTPTRRDLLLRMPSFSSSLSDKGRMVRAVLGWCDDRATVREMADRLREAYPEECPTDTAARQWVWSSLQGRVDIHGKLSDLGST